MVEYNCPRCGYSTKQKSNIRAHYNRKKICKPIVDDIGLDECKKILDRIEDNICGHCNKKFSKKSNLRRHQNKCKDNIIQKLQRKIEENENNERDFEIKKKEIEAIIEKRVSEKMKEEEKPEEKPVTNQYIYVLQEREFVRNNENVYKLGKTVNPKQRLSSYPKGSKVHMVMPCEDCSEAEKYLLDLFRESFVSRKDIGSEYFEGDLLMMTKTAMRYLLDTP